MFELKNVKEKVATTMARSCELRCIVFFGGDTLLLYLADVAVVNEAT